MSTEPYETAALTEVGGNGLGVVVGEADGGVPKHDGLPIGRMLELLKGAERHSSSSHDTVAGEEEQAELQLLVPIDRTPLPEVDRAMPLLSMFPAVVGRRRGRYKVALLKSLQADGGGRWKTRHIQDTVFWLEPSAVAELVRELRDAGVLSYDSIRMTYRMTPTGRVTSALLAALTMPKVEPRRLIKYLSLAMSFALVGGSTSERRRVSPRRSPCCAPTWMSFDG